MIDDSKTDLCRWKAFYLVDPDLISKIRYAVIIHESDAVFITKEDKVYAIGENYKGCLGIGMNVYLGRGEPYCLNFLCGKKIVSIAAGGEPHVLAISEDGDLYAWGGNSYGQSGVGACSILYTPTLCGEFQNTRVKQVACGQYHSLIWTTTEKLYSYGYNDHGQLGFNICSTEVPNLVDGLPNGRNIRAIMCGSFTSFALTDGGELFGWGCNKEGELGNGTFDNTWMPQRVGARHGLVFRSVACGKHHVVALSHTAQVYSWGCNENGQVGIGSSSNVANPTQLRINDEIFFEVGAHFKLNISTAVTCKGNVYVWGELKGAAEWKPRLTSFASAHDVFVTLATETVTYKPLTPLADAESKTSIQYCLRAHFNNHEFSDVTFVFGEIKLHGHTSFLRMRSQYFRGMLNSYWGNQNERAIPICGYSYKVFYAYLQYLYTGKLQIESEDAMELLQLADEYCEKDLKRKCERIIMAETTVENVFGLYATSIKLSAEELERFCFYFAIAHLNAATQSEAFELLDDKLAKKFFKTAGAQNVFRN